MRKHKFAKPLPSFIDKYWHEAFLNPNMILELNISWKIYSLVHKYFIDLRSLDDDSRFLDYINYLLILNSDYLQSTSYGHLSLYTKNPYYF